MIARVQADLREARLARDAARVQVLGTLLAALQGAEKDAGGSLDDAGAVAVLRRERKRRAEAAESFREAGREEDAAREEAEGALIEGYMPAALDPGGARPHGRRGRGRVGRDARRARWAPS